MEATPPSSDAIAARAYQLWQKAGSPEGRDQEHWYQAEQELGAEIANGQRESAGGSTARLPANSNDLPSNRPSLPKATPPTSRGRSAAASAAKPPAPANGTRSSR